GQIGEPRFFSSSFAQQVRTGDIRTRQKVGGGALYDLGIYCLNAARYLFRSEPILAFGCSVRGHDPRFEVDVDETTTALLRFPDERLAQFACSQAASDVSTYRLVGTYGDIVLEPAYEYAEALKCRVTIEGKTQERTFAKHDQFAPELIYFSNCIVDD